MSAIKKKDLEMNKFISIAASIALFNFAYADEVLEAVRVESLYDKIEKEGKVKDVVEKTEVISKKQIEKQQAVSLIEAIEKSPGIDVTTNCSMCGIKRVMLNGMKGEHTTILSDGVPFNSTVSSYYGMDAIGTGDIEDIEIARGSGASLTAPEAIGGTINIVSRRAKKNGMEFDVAAGEQGYRLTSFSAEGITEDKKTGAIVTGTYSNYDQYDQDKNGVNEAPKLENKIISIKLTHELTNSDLLDFKISHSDSKVFGGPMVDESYANALFGQTGTADPSFFGGDVNNQYDGDPMGTLESIDTLRDEYTLKWTHIGDWATIQSTLAYAEATQDSMYEGTDYNNEDKTYFADIKVSQALNDEHFLTYGIDMKTEIMKADSTQFVSTPTSNGHDDFNYNAYGIYLQDSWTINNKTELNLALRGAKITTNFKGQFAKKNEIDETMFLPRMHLRYNHDEYTVSRLSAGQGYRSPLTFFESEHGLIGPDGFGVDIDKIEKSNNISYALSYDKNRLSATASGAYTEIKNLAYIDSEGARPVLKNSDGKVAVRNADIVVGYALTPSLSISGGYEHFWYDDAYKELLSIAATEKQARFMVDYERNGWDAMAQATWSGSRNLEPYGYNDRYNDEGLTSPKSTKAPSFTTVDLKISKEISKNFTLYAGVKNLFDYTQTQKESPLFYDADGEYDVGHIWGPLRGRMTYAGIKAKF